MENELSFFTYALDIDNFLIFWYDRAWGFLSLLRQDDWQNEMRISHKEEQCIFTQPRLEESNNCPNTQARFSRTDDDSFQEPTLTNMPGMSSQAKMWSGGVRCGLRLRAEVRAAAAEPIWALKQPNQTKPKPEQLPPQWPSTEAGSSGDACPQGWPPLMVLCSIQAAKILYPLFSQPPIPAVLSPLSLSASRVLLCCS